jgi:pimeloyl-ACP methyl ester carboxylesterase
MNLVRPNERDVTVNGLKLRVLDWDGSGRPHLLLLHGFTGHAHAWDTLAIALQPHFHVWALHLLRGNPYPGIHYYRWVVSSSLKARPDGRLVWKWHPSIKERRPGDFDWWGLLPSIPTETLVLRGAESMVLDREVAERMVKTLPRARLVEIPRAVHTLHEDNPEAVLDALRDFLDF